MTQLIIKIVALISLLLFSSSFFSQKVGLVLSGGGSSGVAHIGVLKALEENNIPIDYITGTSMGALIGALYASGYSPEEIEEIFLSRQFRNWAEGNLDRKYIYYLRKKDDNPSLFTYKLDMDSPFETSLPTNLISPVAINYGLMKFFAPSSAVAENNFDSLFIPFRCVASDIIMKEPVVLRDGRLSSAVRASIAYPLYLSPISYDDKLLFDGGLYNNFPSDVMYEDFLPDYIIGSNVSSNFSDPSEENIISQIKAITVNNTEYSISCDHSLLIEPGASEFSLFDFDNNQKLIQIGYEATNKKIDSLKSQISERVNKEELERKRELYKKRLPRLVFDNIEVSGLKESQNVYIAKSLRFKGDTISANEIKPEYIKLSSDDKVKSIYPTAKFNEESNYFTLGLNAKKEKDLFVSIGVLFSNRNINEGYIGLQYNVLSKTAISLLANTYFGRLHNSISGGFRFDFPFRIPFYWKTTYTIDGWDYYKSRSTFFEDTKPPFLVINDNYLKSEFALPIAYKGKITVDGTLGELVNNYYQSKQFESTDTTDKTRFRNFSLALNFERNSLNAKQYASSGSFFSFGTRFIRGEEHTIPGSTSIIKDEFDTILSWFQIKATYDKYFNGEGGVRFGLFAEGVYSNQPFFNNYTASVLSAPAFQPLSESRTLFQDQLRAHSYFAVGLKNIYQIFKKVQLRLGGYLFQPYQQILQNSDRRAFYGNEWNEQQFIVSSSLVYNSPIGPLALNLNYYEQEKEDPWSFLFHFGYVIFNKKSLE